VNHLDVEALQQIIENVEESIDAQGISIGAHQKAELIAMLYVRSLDDGRVPGKMTTDQAVWMAH